MTPRENLLSLYRRTGFEQAPAGFLLCPSLKAEFHKRYPNETDYMEYFNFPYRIVYDPGFAWNFAEITKIPARTVDWNIYYPEGFQHEVKFDTWGVAHEANPSAMHMTQMHHPMKDFTDKQELVDYPWPDFCNMDFSYLQPKVDEIHAKELAVFVFMECTIWETAWYLRGMDNLFIDMAMEDEKAWFLFDKITDLACYRAKKFAMAGADILGLGDDIGMQDSAMMSIEMYRTWLKPCLAKVIKAAKNINPDILISYHSCGYVEPFIEELIDAGVDILNPVQPECMDFSDIHQKYGDKISFNGTLGTQQLIPFGTPEAIKQEVFKNLAIAGKKGGLFCCPTHLLEPEVPWENIEAYVNAIEMFNSQRNI
jgi:uroporphyrinogen decarboxylase